MKFYKINIYGRVHGVGFRYTVLNKAKELGLLGIVRNTHDGVEIIVNDERFMERLDIPLSSRIDNQTIEELETEKSRYKDFKIIDSSY
jgi:acylphosphatase